MRWCDVMWCDVMWYDMMWCGAVSCHVFDVMWCDVMWCGVMPCIWCDVMWCDVMWCDVVRCHAMYLMWCDIVNKSVCVYFFYFMHNDTIAWCSYIPQYNASLIFMIFLPNFNLTCNPIALYSSSPFLQCLEGTAFCTGRGTSQKWWRQKKMHTKGDSASSS